METVVLEAQDKSSIFVNDQLRSEASGVIDHVRDLTLTLSIRVAGDEFALPAELTGVLMKVVDHMASGAGIVITSMPDELTTSVAADLIGISRPTLMKHIRAGEIRSHRVGTHTRLSPRDVFAFKRGIELKRRETLAKLLAASDELGEE
ncbi:helix-turn-helix domain-containing protein [Pseudoclavibacter soli]|uniref:helix-turn-helix domain-containing protein n=1 Tax=Pseudoclavibacter soli TaxID=452623 RepID=UPI000481C7E3|nr:helix-turn-helix domain-containing protein [Pseudoclavibacter soli]